MFAAVSLIEPFAHLQVLLAMLEREDAPDGLPFALLTDSQRFIIVGLYQSVDERIAILSPLLEQDQLHPSLVSFAAYVLLRQPDRALPLSASTIARISRINQQIPQAIEEEGGEEEEEESDQEEDDNERQDESDGGGEGQDGGGDGRDQGDGDGNGKDAGGSGEQPPLKRKKVDSTATYASFAAGGGVTSALALQEVRCIVLVSRSCSLTFSACAVSCHYGLCLARARRRRSLERLALAQGLYISSSL